MKFTEEHEWLKPEGDEVIVGITEHAASELGDIVFVELPEVGSTEAIVDEPGKVNEDPMGDGWFFRIKPSDPAQLDEFMDEAAYKKFIG